MPANHSPLNLRNHQSLIIHFIEVFYFIFFCFILPPPQICGSNSRTWPDLLQYGKQLWALAVVLSLPLTYCKTWAGHLPELLGNLSQLHNLWDNHFTHCLWGNYYGPDLSGKGYMHCLSWLHKNPEDKEDIFILILQTKQLRLIQVWWQIQDSNLCLLDSETLLTL